MTSTPDDIAHRIAHTATTHPNRAQLAFDADGTLIDWMEINTRTWQRGTDQTQRIYTVAGGATVDVIRRYITATHPSRHTT